MIFQRITLISLPWKIMNREWRASFLRRLKQNTKACPEKGSYIKKIDVIADDKAVSFLFLELTGNKEISAWHILLKTAAKCTTSAEDFLKDKIFLLFCSSLQAAKPQRSNYIVKYISTNIVLKLLKLNNLPCIVIGAFSGSPGDSLPKGAKFCWNDQKQMRREKVVLKKFKATDSFKCPVYLARLRERVIGMCFVHNSKVNYIRNVL